MWRCSQRKLRGCCSAPRRLLHLAGHAVRGKQAGSSARACCRLLLLLLPLLLTAFAAARLLPRAAWTRLASGPPAHATSTAVVVPFVWCQLQLRLAPNLRAWAANPPCDAGDAAQLAASGTLSLVFYFNRDLEHVAELGGASGVPSLEALWASLGPAQRCFAGGVRFLSARLSAAENQYPVGTCIQFYGAFDVLRAMGFDHWLQLEPDVLATRPGWGTRVAQLAAQNVGCRHFWQAGSRPQYANAHDFNPRVDNGTSTDAHLNGNSLYCLADARFADYLARVQAASPHGCGARTPAGWPLFGFDYAMYRFRVAPEHAAYAAAVAHKFVPAGFIVNVARQALDVAALQATHPEMRLVHTQAHFNDSRQMAVCRKRERSFDQPAQPAGATQPAVASAAADAPEGCGRVLFAERFQHTAGQQAYEVTGGAHVVSGEAAGASAAMLLTSVFAGDIGHVEFNAVYSKRALCGDAQGCSFSAVFSVSVGKPNGTKLVADGMAFALVDAAKQTSGAAAFFAVSGVLVPADALSLVVDEYDNGDGAGYLLVSSFNGRAVVLARKAGLHASLLSGERMELRILLTARNRLRVEADGWVVFHDEYAAAPDAFFLLVSANSGDYSSAHRMHSVHVCMPDGAPAVP
jgi:hypothetical protein